MGRIFAAGVLSLPEERMRTEESFQVSGFQGIAENLALAGW